MSVGSEPTDKLDLLGARAEQDLRFIRDTMQRASAFTAVSGWGSVAIGVVGLAAALVAGGQQVDRLWLSTWLLAATLSAAIGVWTTYRKAKAAGVSIFRGPGARFAFSLATPMVAAALVSIPLYRAGAVELLPGLWLLLYGAGIVTGGVFSVRLIPTMGLCFMLLGVLSFLVPWRDAMMALGFGGLHTVFGFAIVRRHGG